MNISSLLFLKPILTALILPPAGPLLLVFIGIGLGMCMGMGRGTSSRAKIKGALKKTSTGLILTGSLVLWTLSCEDTAVWMSKHFLPQFEPVSTTQLSAAQAILVLGGGTESFNPSYAGPELASNAYDRLRYAGYLSKLTGLPIVYSGGIGWGDKTQGPSEAQVAAATLKRDWNIELKYAEGASRDTRENANLSYAAFSPKGIKSVALVTHAWHMPRASRNFREAGFTVIPAPMGFVLHSGSAVLDALPSEEGLQDSRWILKEWLGLLLT